MMIGLRLAAIRAGTRTARRKRPEPMHMLLIEAWSVGKRDVIMFMVGEEECDKNEKKNFDDEKREENEKREKTTKISCRNTN